MIDAAVREGAERPENNSSDSTSDELSELRDLLLAPEQVQLNDLQERLDNPARYANDVSRILPTAVTLSTKRNDALAGALMPAVESAIDVSVRKNPQRLVDSIFPVMGPAIRKAIASAFREMVQSLNQTLDYSISLRGLKWRLEALRTGRSFAEVVLSHTLLYRVEQVFLIQRETGLLLQHVETGAAPVQDADMVSGMLTAIQDFVQDSFGAGRTDALDSMEVGELTVWIERGSHAVLAAVIRGTAPIELRRSMQDALDAIHVEQRQALESFAGDASAFVASRPQLESCLQTRTEVTHRGKPSPLLLAAASLIVIAIGLWLFFSTRESRRWNDYLSRLRTQPGLVVISAEKRDGKYHITGLRDPLAADPATLLQGSTLDPKSIVGRWEVFQSSEPELVLARMNRALEPPDTVSLSVEDGALLARGYAPHNWISEARKLVLMVPGIARFDEQNLIDVDLARGQLISVGRNIEQHVIRFALGSSEIGSDQIDVLSAAASEIRRIELLSQPLGVQTRVFVWGHADQSGSQALNERLITARAQQVQSALMAAGVTAASLEIGNTAAAARMRNQTRSVTFEVKPAGSPALEK